MPLENVESFRAWATKLGCPPEAIPSEEALKSVLRTRLRGVFENMTRRVQPRQEVQAVRENILIQKMGKLKEQAVEPACSRNFLPKEMQTYVKVKELEKQKARIEMCIEEHKKEYDALAAGIKTKNIQCINLSHKLDLQKAKVNLLAFKSKALDKKLKEEEQNKQKILATMPVRLTAQNANKNQAMDSVKKALQELDKFYALHDNNNNNPQCLQLAKEELWQKMRAIFADLPNFLFFNAIMRLMDEQIQHIMSLNAAMQSQSSAQSMASAVQTLKKPITAFDMKLMRTKVELLGMVAKFLAAREERIDLEERFTDAYGPFVEALVHKMQLFNTETDDQSNEIISEYILHYNLRNFNKAQNEFLAQQIEFYKQEIERGAKHLEKHEVMLSTVKQVYSDINASINRIHHDMLQFSQIKQKIIYSKNMLKHMLDEMQSTVSGAAVKSNFIKPGNGPNSPSSASSFEMGGYGDTVFCSTKLDFDSTIMSLNSTVRRSPGAGGNTTLLSTAGGYGEGRLTLPPHTLELSCFAEIPLENLDCFAPPCAFYLAANPLVLEPRALCATMQLIPGSLLTPCGALQEVRNRIMWAELIAQHTVDLKLNLDALMVDPEVCKQKIRKQHEHIDELLDKIDMTRCNTEHTLQQLGKLYEFMLKNPLRHYIPATKKFNNQTYADYEAEFTMYYRMATVGCSIKH